MIALGTRRMPPRTSLLSLPDGTRRPIGIRTIKKGKGWSDIGYNGSSIRMTGPKNGPLQHGDACPSL